MDRVEMMRAFREVARFEAFAPAARNLGISTSAISRHVAALEQWLRVQLFHRTTRHVQLTDAGKAYLARCESILGAVRDLERAELDDAGDLTGEIRMTAPVYLGRRRVAPVLREFLARHPGLGLDLMLHDRAVDLIGEGFDLAIRIARPRDSSLVVRRLGGVRLVHVASTGYLERRGTPKSIRDLANHDCVIDLASGEAGRWTYRSGNASMSQRVDGRIKVNDGEAACDFAVAGLGVARLPRFFVEDALAVGELAPVLEDFEQDEVGIYAVYPPTRFLARPVRALIDAMAAGMKAA